MLESVKDSSVYKSLKLDKALSHAYLFYSADREKNNQVALTFARSLVCETGSSCGVCRACKQFLSASHPDVFVLEQAAVKVDDVKVLMDKFSTKPISASKKVFVVLNAEVINEIAQNKLLKSLEEPNESSIFVLTTTKTDKLLPTILSRLNKVFVPNFSVTDKHAIAAELKTQGIDVSAYAEKDFTLTEMFNLATDENYLSTAKAICNMFANLNTTADIPRVVTELDVADKALFFSILQEMFIGAINEKENKFDTSFLLPIQTKFNKKAISKCLPLIEDAYKKFMSNVNFTYILDNLLFNILKEKFLCS